MAQWHVCGAWAGALLPACPGGRSAECGRVAETGSECDRGTSLPAGLLAFRLHAPCGGRAAGLAELRWRNAAGDRLKLARAPRPLVRRAGAARLDLWQRRGAARPGAGGSLAPAELRRRGVG